MNGYEFTTAHNVTLRFNYASMGDRLIAYIIDNLIKGGVVLLFFIVGAFIRDSITWQDSPAFWIIYIIICLVPFIFYTLFFEYFTNGQTPGKRMRKIRVTSEDSEQLTFGKCLVRWLFRIVDFGFYGIPAMVAISVSAKKQRIGDMVGGTIVVSLVSDKTLDQTIYTYVAPGREVRYQQAARLTAREVEIIKEVIRQYEDEGKFDLVPATAERVRTAIQADHSLDDLAFLRTVVEDYFTLAAT